MPKFLKIVAMFVVAMFSCSIPIIPPKVAPAISVNVVIEAVTLYHGRVFILKSTIIPGVEYWNASGRIPARKRVWVEVYAAVNGHIEIVKILDAKRIPAKPEMWEFKEFEKEIN